MEKKQMTVVEKTNLFNQLTRKHVQTLPSVNLSENTTVSFSLPKARLLQRITLLVEGNLTATGGTYTKKGMLDFLRQIRVEVNNGFSPFRASAESLVDYGKTIFNGNFNSVTNESGNQNVYIDLPVAINTRDAVGLINLQNPTTEVNVSLDLAGYENVVGVAGATGSIKLTPIVTSFSIPSADILPDLGVLKLVHEFKNDLDSGETTVKLPVGTIFRKLIIRVEDGAGARQKLINSIKLVLNQADTPFNVYADFILNEMERAYNVNDVGLYIFDFSNQGLPNFGGSRDYIDTSRLTEFWLRVETVSSGKISILAEMLSRLTS